MIFGGLFASHIPSATTLLKGEEGSHLLSKKISADVVLGREFMQSQRNNIRKACTVFFSCSAIIYS